jgi:hypothetical protein
MAIEMGSRLKHAWNAFTGKDNILIDRPGFINVGPSSGYNPDHRRVISGSERTIISSIYNRIAVDVSSTTFEHVRVDDNDRYSETIYSGLNDCMNVAANIDQTGNAFMLDVALSLLDEGCVAVVPVDTTLDPFMTQSYDVNTMRVAKIIGWHPQYVDLQLYNDRTGRQQQITLPKSSVAIIENPFYSVMNEPNSTLKRLTYKLGLLDDADSKANSSKLDMIIQLPYSIKTDTQQQRADTRKKTIEAQLTDSKYGIAYIDSTEHITQLNRPIENTLLGQINDLTAQLYSQLGIDETILNGTASSETMNNYYQRTVAPIIKAIRDEFVRKFISKTARSQHQTIMTFQDPFKYLTVVQIAQLVDSLSRNEVLSGNEFRTALGFKPSDDPGAEELRNKNLIDTNADYGSTYSPATEIVPDSVSIQDSSESS